MYGNTDLLRLLLRAIYTNLNLQNGNLEWVFGILYIYIYMNNYMNNTYIYSTYMPENSIEMRKACTAYI